MRLPTPPSPLILSLLSLIPYVLSSTLLDNGPGNTLCLDLSAIDLTHANDNALGLATDLTVNLGLGLCLCIYEGVLTVPAQAALDAAITANVVAEVGNVLGLGTLGLGQEDVADGIKAAVLVLLQEGHTSCTYPSNAIPFGCVNCQWTCDTAHGYQNCQDRCIPASQPCPSSNSKSRRQLQLNKAGLLSSNHPLNLPLGHVLHARAASAYPPHDVTSVNGNAKVNANAEANNKANTKANANANVDASADASLAGHDLGESKGRTHYIRSNPDVLKANADAKAQAEAAYLLELGISCQNGWTPCRSGGDFKRGNTGVVDQSWDCVDILNDLECCGGCLHPILDGTTGKDCSIIKGVGSVACVQGQCKISSCQDHWHYDPNLKLCVELNVGADVSARELSGDYKYAPYL